MKPTKKSQLAASRKLVLKHTRAIDEARRRLQLRESNDYWSNERNIKAMLNSRLLNILQVRPTREQALADLEDRLLWAVDLYAVSTGRIPYKICILPGKLLGKLHVFPHESECN